MNDDRWDGEYDVDDSDEDTTACPYCGREIYDDAVQCPHCHMYIENNALPASGPAWRHRLYQITAVVLIVVLLLLWVVYRF